MFSSRQAKPVFLHRNKPLHGMKAIAGRLFEAPRSH